MVQLITNIDWSVNKRREMFLEKVSDLVLFAHPSPGCLKGYF